MIPHSLGSLRSCRSYAINLNPKPYKSLKGTRIDPSRGTAVLLRKASLHAIHHGLGILAPKSSSQLSSGTSLPGFVGLLGVFF